MLKNALLPSVATEMRDDFSKEWPPIHLPPPIASPVSVFRLKIDAKYHLTSQNSYPMLPSLNWCRKSSDLRPQEPRYAYTLAFYLNQKGEKTEAVRTLKTIIEKYPQYKDAEMLLREISK